MAASPPEHETMSRHIAIASKKANSFSSLSPFYYLGPGSRLDDSQYPDKQAKQCRQDEKDERYELQHPARAVHPRVSLSLPGSPHYRADDEQKQADTRGAKNDHQYDVDEQYPDESHYVPLFYHFFPRALMSVRQHLS